MSEQWPATADSFHDARDDGVIVLPPEEIEAYAEVLRRPLVDPAPIADPALADQEDSDPYEINLSSCPWWQTRGLPDAQRGLCSHGCRDEPECQTCEPVGGWPPLPADPEEGQ